MAAAAWTCPMMLRAWLLGTTALLPAASALAQGVAPNALPTGGQVAAGQAAISQSGTAMQVRQGSDRAAINWQGFNVGANASVNFQQPSATSWTLNRVTGPDPSVIAGRITANGGVAIVNQSGMVFARGAQVNVGSLIASAANITNENFMAGRMVFDGAPKPGAKVENHGSITVSDRGLAALVGPRVGNTGTIRARLGRVALAGAETYSLDLAGDGLLSIDVTQAVRTAEGGATALVTNSGVIEAQGGAVLITAHAASGLVEDLVRNTGRISADTAAGRTGQVALRAEGGGVRVEGQVTARGGAAAPGGRVELRGSTATTVAGAGRVDASGGAGGGTVLVGTSGVGRNQSMSARTSVEAGARLRADARRQGNGGTIAVNSTTETVARGSYSARGGARGGDGGLVELSGQRALTIAAQVDLAAAAGRRGTLLLDPVSIEVVADAETPADPDRPLNTVTATTGGGGTVRVRASDLDVAGTVTLQAEQNITISTAVNIGTNTLNLHADGAITQASLATITAGTLVIRGKDGTGAAGLVNLNQANSVGFLSAQVNGSLTFDNGTGNLTVTAATGSTVALLTKGSLTLQGSVGQSGAAVWLSVDGAISQTAGAVTGASLTIAGAAAAAPASIDLTQANALGLLNAQSAGDLAFTNGNTALTVSRATSGGDNAAVSLTSGLGITLAGAVGGAGAGTVGTTGAAVTLTAGGTISQSNGAVTARSLAVTATGGSIALTQPGNEIAGLTATATGTGNGIAVRSGQVMSILAGGVTAGGGSTIGLTAQGLTAGHAVGFAAADPANRISLVADAIAATAAIDAGSSGTIAIAPLSTNRDVDIGGTTAGALQIGAPTFGRLTARHIDIAATGSGALAVSIDVAAAELSLAAGGDITQASGKAITAAALTATSGAGAITLDQSNAVAALDATASSGAVSFRNGTADLAVAKAIGTVVTLTTAGALEVRGAVGQGGAAVGLHVGGAISQTGGVVTASTLTIRDATGAAGTAAASIDLGGANAIASLDAKATGTLNLANGSADLTVAQATGSSVTLTTGGALALGGAVGQSGTAVTLQADGAITQTASGLVTAATLTVRGAPDGTSGAESLTLDRLNMVGTLNARVTNGLVLGNGGNNLIVAQAVGSSVTLTTGGALALQGPVGQSGAAVRLNVTGALSQTDGTVTAGSLTVRDATGLAGTGAASIALDQLNTIASANATASGALSLTNGITSLAVTQALGSSVTLATAGALTLEGAVGQAGAGVTLNASGAISQTAAGLVTASTLTIRGAGGGTTPAASAKLDQANTVDALDARVTSELLLRSSATSLAAVQAVGSTVTLTTGGALDLQGTVGQAGAAVNLNVTGAVTQTDGIVQAGTLTVRDAAGSGHATSIALGRANAVGALDAQALSALGVSNGSTSLVVTQAVGSDVTLATGGALELKGAVGQAGGSVALNAGGAISQTAGEVTATTLTIRGAAGGASPAESAVLGRGNTIGTLDARVANGLRLDNGGNDLAVAQAVGGTVTLATSGALTLQGAVGQSGATVQLNVSGALAQAGGAVMADSLVVRDATGAAGTAAASIALDRTNVIRAIDARATGALSLVNDGTALAVNQAVGDGVTLTTGGALELKGAVGQAAAAVTINAGGAITQTGGAVTATTLTVRGAAGGTSAAAGAAFGEANAVGSLDAWVTNALRFDNGSNDLGIAQAVGQDVALVTGGALSLAGAVGQAGGTVALGADGAITQTPTGLVTAGTLTIRGRDGSMEAGSVTLGLANAVGTLDAVAVGDIAVTTSGAALRVDQARRTAGGGTVQIASTGTMTLAGEIGSAGTTMLLSASGGGIEQTGGRVRSSSLIAAGGAGPVVIGLAGNDIAQVTATATGAGNGVSIRSEVPMGIGPGGIAAGAGSTIALHGPALRIDNALGFAAPDAGNRILLATDALTALADIDAGPGGQVRIASITNGIDVGGLTAALQLDMATLGRVTAGRLVLDAKGDLLLSTDVTLAPTLELIAGGRISQPAGVLSVARLSATASGGSISLTSANQLGTIAGSLADETIGMSATGDIAVTNAALLGIEARILGGIGQTITLRAADLSVGAVIGARSGSLGALNLLPVAAKAVTLGADDGTSFALSSSEIARLQPGAAGTLRIGSDGSATTATTMVVAGDVAPGSAAVLDLRAQRVSQSGGVVTVPVVTGVASDGFALDRVDGTGGPVNLIEDIGAAGIRVSDGGIALLSARSLNVRGDVVAAGAGNVSLRGLGLTIGDPLAPSTAVLVEAGNGDVTLTGGAPGVSVLALATLRAGDTSGLHGDIIVTGGSVASQGSFDTGTLAGGRDIRLDADGPMVVDGQVRAARDLLVNAGGSYVARNALSAGRDVVLTAAGIVGVDATGSVTAGRDATLSGSGSSTIRGNVTAGRTARVTASNGSISVESGIAITAGTDAAADASAELRLAARSTVGIDGRLVSNGRPIFVTSTTSLISNRGTIDSRGAGSAGAITLTADAQVFNGAGASILGGAVTLTGRTLISQAGLIEGSNLDITGGSAGAPGVTGFTAASGSATKASGTLTVTAASGDVTAADATLHADGAMTVRAEAGKVTLTGTTVSGGAAIALQAGGGDITQDGGLISAATSLTLGASGNVTQIGGGRIVAPLLTGAAAGSLTLLNGISSASVLADRAAGNFIGSIAGFTAGGDLTLASTGPLLRISGPVRAGSGRELRLFADDFALAAGLAAPGGTVSLSPYVRDGSVALVLGGAAGTGAANTVTLDSAELGLLPVGAAGRLRFGRADTTDGGSDFSSVSIAGSIDLADPVNGANAKVGRLELLARDGITQQAGTRLVVPVLAATAGADIHLDPGGGANHIGGLAGLVTPGNLRLRNGFSGAMGVAAGSGTAGDAGAGPDGILVGEGKSITLRGDDFAITGAVRAPSGLIEILPETQGQAIILGGIGGAAGTLSLDGAELALVGGGTPPDARAAALLRIGGMAGPTMPTAGMITLGGAVDLQGTIARVQALELLSTGAILGSDGAITVPVLRATAAGNVILDNAGNSFLPNAVSGADVTIRQAGDLRLANAVASIGGLDAPGGVTATGTLSLISGGTITQESGALVRAGTLRLQSGGAVTLGERNRFATLGAASIGGAAVGSLIRGVGYTVSGLVTTAGSIRLAVTDFGNLAVTGSIVAAGAAELAIEQGLAAGVGAPPYGQIDVSGTIEAGTTISLGTDMGPVQLTGAVLTAGGAITLATGALDLAGPAGIGINRSTVTAGGDLRVVASGFGGQEGPLAVSGSVLRARGDIRLSANRALQVGTSTLEATGGQLWTSGAGTMGLDATTVQAGGAIVLQADRDVTIGASTLTAATGMATVAAGLVTAGAITVDGSGLTGGAGLSVAAKQGAVMAGSTLIAKAGDASVTTDALDISTVGSTLSAEGGALDVTATLGSIALDTSMLAAGRALTLAAPGGSIGQRRGSLAGASLTASAGTGITVTNDGGAAAVLQARTGSLTLTSSAGDVALSGARVSAATGLALTATAGTLRLASASGIAGTSVALASGGATSIAGSSLTATGGALDANAGGGIAVTGSSLVAGLAVSLAAQAGVSVTGTTLAALGGDLGVTATTGDIGFDTGAASASGALTLGARQGRISQRRGSLAGGTLAAQAGFGIAVTGDGGPTASLGATGGALSLGTAAGGIGITGAALAAAGDLGVTANAGAIAIGRSSLTAGNAAVLQAAAGIGLTDATIQAGGAIGLTTAGADAMLLRTRLAAGGDLALTAAGRLGLDVVTGTASLAMVLTSAGDTAIGGSSLTATGGGLTATAGGGILLTGSTLQAARDATVTAQGSVGAAGSVLTAQAGGLGILAATGTIGLDGSAASAGGALALTARTGGISQQGGSLSGASTTLQAATGIVAAADGRDAPRLTARSGALGLSTVTGNVTLTDAVLLAATDLGVATGGGGIRATGTGLAATSGSLTAQAAGAVSLDGSTVTAGGAMTLAAGQGLALTTVQLQSGGAMTAASATGDAVLADAVLAAGGPLAITASAGRLTQTRGSVTGGGDVSLRGAGDLLVTDAGSGTRAVLRSMGGALSLRSDAGGVTLRNAVGSGATALGLAAGGGISLTDTTLTTPGRLAAAAGSGSLAVLRSSLASTAGDIELTAGGAGSIGASSLRASRQVRVVSGGAMTLGGLTLDADTGDFEAGRADPAAYGATNGSSGMTTNGVNASIGTALLFAAPGGVVNLGPTLVMPRGAPLPAVLFDTRLAPERNPLGIVRPDIAGVTANQQPTQVRSAPGAQGPGAFGLPNQTTAAGPVVLNVNAGRSAVFLLVDGGSVSGNVTAGRLAVHGAAGGATLFGTLGGSAGAEAARFADVTRPIAPNSLQRYRFNSCVIGSINCVVPPSIQVLPPRPTDQARFTIENNRINLTDVLIPNIGEEDDE